MKLQRNAVSGIMVTLLLISMLNLAFDIHPVKAEGTIYIRPDGSIDPPTAPISSIDNFTYTLTDNINDSIVIQRDNIIVDGMGYTVQGTGSGRGIDLSERDNVTIKNMEIKAFDSGIWLYESSNNTISGNNITANIRYGICIWRSPSNTISGNDITATKFYGVLISSTSHNAVFENHIANSSRGILVVKSSNNTFSWNHIKSNEIGINPSGSSNNSIFGNHMMNNENGVWLYTSFSNLISRNNITANTRGIVLEHSFNTSISENEITANDNGISSWSNSSYNTVSENSIRNNRRGIHLYLSSNSTISKNNITRNYEGISLLYSDDNTISGNNITNHHGGIAAHSSDHNNIFGNFMTNNSMGIVTYGSDYNKILRNNILNGAMYGTRLRMDSDDNIVIGNLIAHHTDYGIDISADSSNNLIYHNNFVNNSIQVNTENSMNFWDNGYPSGGNYWTDYNGTDVFLGPSQNIHGMDGIGDAPYVIDENNQDGYPLMKPYISGNLTVSIYTDKYTYHAGEVMQLGLNVANPDSVKYLCFAIWVELSDSSIYQYMHEHSVVLPIGTVYINPAFDSITLPNIPSGNYTWHAAFLERATHTIIVEDTAQWEFV